MGLSLPRPRSLKTRVTLFTLLIFVCGIWSIAFFLSQMLRSDMRALLNRQQFATVSFMAAEADRELSRLLGVLGRAASQVPAELLDDNAALHRFLEARPVLVDQFSGGVIVIDSNGVARAETPSTAHRTGINYSFLEPVTAALQEGKSSISPPRVDHALGAPVFSMTVPLRTDDGRVIGVLAGVIDLSKPNFLDQITEHRYGESGYYLIEDPRTRRVITATGRTRLLDSLPELGKSRLNDRFIEGYDETGMMLDRNGGAVLVSARRLPTAGWFLVAALPENEAFALIHSMQRYMLQATLLLTLLAGGLTWWMLRRELSPMVAAIRTLTTLSDDKQPPQPIPNASHDEIGDLIDGFNRLLGTLSKREQTLQSTLNFQQVLMDAVPSPLFYKDAHGVYIGCNKAFEAYLGIGRDKLIGRTVYDISPRDLAERYDRADRELLANPGVQTYEAVVVYADGSRHNVIFNKATFVDMDGSIGGQIGVILDITERKQAEDRIRYLAFYDHLTGLPNRRLFNDRLQQAMAASQRNRCYGALMFLDLDNFKPLNDQHGHAVGDLLLSEAGLRLKQCVRAMDTVARFGGDEFVVMLAELSMDREESAQQARVVGEKVREALSVPYRLNAAGANGDELRILHRCTVSIGIALFIDHEQTPDDLLKWADAAMYRAKEAGRDRVHLHCHGEGAPDARRDDDEEPPEPETPV